MCTEVGITMHDFLISGLSSHKIRLQFITGNTSLQSISTKLGDIKLCEISGNRKILSALFEWHYIFPNEQLIWGWKYLVNDYYYHRIFWYIFPTNNLEEGDVRVYFPNSSILKEYYDIYPKKKRKLDHEVTLLTVWQEIMHIYQKTTLTRTWRHLISLITTFPFLKVEALALI